MSLNTPQFLELAELARELNEPGEDNNEYVRGQVNLLCDASGIPYAGDLISDVLTEYVTHKRDDLNVALIETLASYLRS